MQSKVETSEAKHIFIDIVNYTYKRSVEAQSDLINILNQIVINTIDNLKINNDELIYIPTGDGMCITLLNVSSPYDIHILIALKILESIHTSNQKQEDEMRKFNIRIGINENIDNIITDINGKKNISGSGINFAARIEGLGDKSQILVGNSVFEKLIHRENYMKSFVSFSSEVKHGIPLKVHQFIDKNIEYLNNETPSRFRKTPAKTIRISKKQGYYIANCLVNEAFLEQNAGSGQNRVSLIVLMYQLTRDSIDHEKISRVRPDEKPKRVKRLIQKQFDYIQSIDYYIVGDLASYWLKELNELSDCFSEEYLFVSQKGKQKLLSDQPNICKAFNIK